MSGYKFISKCLAIFLVLTGFLTGPYLYGSRNASACMISGGCCCCDEPGDGSKADKHNSSVADRCECSLSQSEVPINIPLDTEIPAKITNIVAALLNHTFPGKLNLHHSPKVVPQVMTVRNSGPPLFILNSSLVI